MFKMALRRPILQAHLQGRLLDEILARLYFEISVSKFQFTAHNVRIRIQWLQFAKSMRYVDLFLGTVNCDDYTSKTAGCVPIGIRTLCVN